jgi:hypothetical protein
MSGSTPVGGQSTPSDFASLSPRGSELWPVVVPLGAILPCAVVCVGVQFALARAVAGGAVCAGGVAGAGGACASATLQPANTRLAVSIVCLIVIPTKLRFRRDVPDQARRRQDLM